MINRKHTMLRMVQILAVGLIIAILSYLLHPDIGQFSVIYNGQPLVDPIGRFAAIPTFLLMFGLAGILMLILFLGLGLFVFTGAVVVSFLVSIIIAPYLWPVLGLIILIMALMSASHVQK